MLQIEKKVRNFWIEKELSSSYLISKYRAEYSLMLINKVMTDFMISSKIEANEKKKKSKASD